MPHSLIQYQNFHKKEKLYKCTECARHLTKWGEYKKASAKVGAFPTILNSTPLQGHTSPFPYFIFHSTHHLTLLSIYIYSKNVLTSSTRIQVLKEGVLQSYISSVPRTKPGMQ